MATLNYRPDQPNVYQGKQIVITSDRVLFNAAEDSILLFSNESIGLNTAGTINIDTGKDQVLNRVVINSPNIFLGLDGSQPPTQPAVLGETLRIWLEEMLGLVEDLLEWLKSEYNVTYGKGELSTPGVNPHVGLTTEINLLRESIKDMFSEKVKLV